MSPPPPAHQQSGLYTDCQACRITGTLTFSAVGLYALTAARAQAKTPVGRGVASLAGCGESACHRTLFAKVERLITDGPDHLQASSQ